MPGWQQREHAAGELRAGLERRQAIRAQGRRFRRDPAAYLRGLEDPLIKEPLPPWIECANKCPLSNV